MDIVKLMSILPQNFLSYTVGKFFDINWPKSLQVFLNKAFVSLFNIDMGEAEKSIESYCSITELFTRKLKPALRPLANETIVSPCDGWLVRSEEVKDRQCLQVKGIYYSPAELAFGENFKGKGENLSWYTTIYLAPHNYHRVHTPVEGVLTRIDYIPGKLWPVNRKFTAVIPRLFCQNERMVFTIQLENGSALFLVMVGAFNVGRMSTPFSKIITNQLEQGKPASEDFSAQPIPLKQGDELGIFSLGSTVVLLYDKETTGLLKLKPCYEKELCLGEVLSQ